MRVRFKFSFNLFLICLLCSAAFAQRFQPRQSAEVWQEALNSLAQLRDSLSDVENECLKIRARIQLGEMLWTRDEAQARQVFEEAFSLAFNSGLQAGKEGCAAQSRNVLGFVVLKSIARRDAEWAANLVDSLPDEPAASNFKDGSKDGAKRQDLKTLLRGSLAAQPQEANEDDSLEQIRAPLFGGAAAETNFNQNSVELASLISLDAPAMPNNFADQRFEAIHALFSGDFNRAMRLYEKNGDQQMRSQFNALARFREMNATLSPGDEQEATLRAQTLAGLVGRASAFADLANITRKKKGALQAIEILLIARQSLNAEKASAEKAQALLMLAEAITELDPERGFEFAQAAIETFNSTDSGAASPQSEAGYEASGLRQSLTRLSRYDFARAWNLALSINNRQTAWFTKLAVCKGSLDEESAAEKAAQN